MKIKGIIFLVALLGTTFTHTQVYAQNTILWGVHDLPPLQITTGEYTNQGLYDGVLDLFQSKMPQYTHQKREANAKRFWKWLKEKKQFCYVASIPTPERLKHAYYSMANGFHVSNFVVMTKSTAKSMGLRDTVSLKKLLLTSEIEGGIVAARSYGNDIDNMLAQYKQANVKSYVSGNLGQSVYQMLLGSRMDYIIEYPFVVEYFDKVLGTKNQSISLMIEEITPFSMGHTACPKNEWGRKIIDQINTILTEHRGSKDYRKMMERWQSPAVTNRIRTNYNAFLNTKEMEQK